MTEQVERFRPTSGRITGLLAVAMAAFVVVLGLVEREAAYAPEVVWSALVAGVLAWASMLRPGLWATESDLVMRNMLETVSIPLAAIEQVAVRQVVAVRAGDKRYVSPAVGRSWRKTALPQKEQQKEKASGTIYYPAFVEERIAQLAEQARTDAGVSLMSDEQVALAADVRRFPAWPEIVGLVVCLAGLCVTLLL